MTTATSAGLDFFLPRAAEKAPLARDISFLSHLEELRISNCAENPPET
jgi:hypothetical protein